MDNSWSFYYFECSVGAKTILKKFMKGFPKETLGDIIEREIPPNYGICGVYTNEKGASELDLSMPTESLDEFAVKNI